MSGEPTVLIVPGQAAPQPGPPPGGPAATLAWVALTVLVVASVWAGLNGRRRRRTDPRELAFRRLASSQGWSRSQVRSLRRAAAGLGLESPVGLAVSPSLAGRVLAEGGRGQSFGG